MLKTIRFFFIHIRHSLQLDAYLVARSWVIIGSLVLGVQIILLVFILIVYEPFMKHTHKK